MISKLKLTIAEHRIFQVIGSGILHRKIKRANFTNGQLYGQIIGIVASVAKSARIDDLIDKFENKTSPALAQMELNINKLVDQVEENKKASSDFVSSTHKKR